MSLSWITPCMHVPDTTVPTPWMEGGGTGEGRGGERGVTLNKHGNKHNCANNKTEYLDSTANSVHIEIIKDLNAASLVYKSISEINRLLQERSRFRRSGTRGVCPRDQTYDQTGD